MGQAESNQVVSSYLAGIQQRLQQNQLAQQKAYQDKEAEQREEQLKLSRDQFEQSNKQADLANKLAQAQFSFNIQQHAAEHAQNTEPDLNPDTGQPIVDEKGIGTYTIQGPTGVPIQLKAPTREQQQNIANLNLQKKLDLEEQSRAKTANLEHINRLEEIGVNKSAALAMEMTRGNIEGQLKRMELNAQAERDRLNRESEMMRVKITAGLDDGMGGQSVEIQQTANNALGGIITDKDLIGYSKPVQMAIRNLVTRNHGVIPKQKDVEGIRDILSLSNKFEKVKSAIAQQPNIGDSTGGAAQAWLEGKVQGMTDPAAKEAFGELEGFAPSIAKIIGGEQGQRLQKYTIEIANKSFVPSITTPKVENIRRYNNLIQQIQSAAKDRLANYPEKQRDLMLSNFGITKIQPYSVINDEQKAPIQQNQPVPQQNKVDLSQFDTRGK